MAQGNLIKFSEAIINDAEEKRRIYIQKLQQENQLALEKKYKELQSSYERDTRRECDKIEEELSAEIAKRRNEIKVELIELRNKMFESVFDEVTKKIKKFTATDEYKSTLKKWFNDALAELGATDMVCSASKQDIELLKNETEGVSFVETTKEIFGGFILTSKEKGVLIDCTLKERIEEEKARFVKESGLIIE